MRKVRHPGGQGGDVGHAGRIRGEIQRSGRSPVAPTRPPPFRRISYEEQVRADPVPPLANIQDFLVQAMQRWTIREPVELERDNGDFELLGSGPTVGPAAGLSSSRRNPHPKPTRSLQTLPCGIWRSSTGRRREDEGSSDDLGEAVMSGGHGVGDRNFNGGRGWAPQPSGGQWAEGRGGGRGFYGPPPPESYEFQEPPPPEFGYGIGEPPPPEFF